MIANWRRLGTISRKSSSRLLALSACCRENPVTLPPGRERLATRPMPRGSTASAKTMGMDGCRLFQFGGSASVRDDDVDFLLHEFGRELGDPLGLPLRPTVFESNGPTLNPAKFAQPLRESDSPRYLHTETRSPRRATVGSRLAGCACATSGHVRRASDKSDEFAPPHRLPLRLRTKHFQSPM